MREMNSLMPDSADANERVSGLIAEGLKRLTEGNYKLAKATFETAVNESPNSVEALRGLGEAYYAMGDLIEAARCTEAALKLSEEAPRSLNNAGVIFHANKKYIDAEAAFHKALSFDPDFADPYINLCELWGRIWTKTPHRPSRRQDVVQWISENAADGVRETLLKENRQLRETLLQQYHLSYQKSPKKILLHRPDNGALKYLMESWCEVLNYMGIETSVINWSENTQAQCESFRPDVFITVADPAYISQIDIDYLKRYKKERGLLIGHISTFKHSYTPCDFLITFHLAPERDSVMSKVDIPLLSLPFAINPLQHYMRPGVEIWDYFFVGTYSPFKIQETNSYLFPILHHRSGILAGVNWRVGVGELNVKEAVILYNFARIYPNYHIHWQIEEFNEINERTYIIPACGGFELVDNPAAMRELFADDEMAVANSPDEYHEMVDYFLNNPDKRINYIEKGMRRVWSQYTLFHVLRRLADFLNIPGELNIEKKA